MTGATFLRADLHVHTHADSELDPKPDLKSYVDEAVAQEIGVMAITDHNSVDFVRPAMEAAAGSSLLIIPGVEISTHEGHLLALFSPEKVDRLEELCRPTNLQLKELSPTDKRSSRSMIDLVNEIYESGGLAIPAHIDAPNGAADRLSSAQWQELLASPAIAGLEFSEHEALRLWFSDQDPDSGRKEAWRGRLGIPELRERGLARLMSSDAHSPDKVGRDRSSRTLTRLRIDDRNFEALRNAIHLNPKARCKAEITLPATYPRILNAAFEGGFLDGVEIDLSSNLTCLIGGRGSGKSTALLSIRAALGAKLPSDEDPDDPHRMPDKTTVTFVDAAGSTRVAVRSRGESPTDPEGASIGLRLAELGQEEAGRLARGYTESPGLLLDFLDGFVVRHRYTEAEDDLLGKLEDNGSELIRSAGVTSQIAEKKVEKAKLEGSLKAATEGKLEAVAQYASLLASQEPMLSELERVVAEATEPATGRTTSLDIDVLAAQFGVDANSPTSKKHIDGESGLRESLVKFSKARDEILRRAKESLAAASSDVSEAIASWNAEHQNLKERLQKKKEELREKGLHVEAGAVQEIADRLNDVNQSLVRLDQKLKEFQDARRNRKQLVEDLHRNRENQWLERKAVLKRIADEANSYSDDVTIQVSFLREGNNQEWSSWLTDHFGFRQPRVSRIASAISPRKFAECILSEQGRSELVEISDSEDDYCFTSEQLARKWTFSDIFQLETMLLPDKAQLLVQRVGETRPQQFNHLSAGQQRSVLLGLLLCAERSEPLILDQPEDHLDGQYVASSVVSHLEAAKERRQVLIATHSANLTVLGDAELVIPMVVRDGKGRPEDVGAVDRPETRSQVCSLLEGGLEAYKKRGNRYGLEFKV